jgi:hypothetical protein
LTFYFFSPVHRFTLLFCVKSFQDKTSFNFLSVDPLWEQAFVGHSQSGREIVIVPLPDNSLSDDNQGRMGAKLLFSKPSEDTVTANVLVYLADTAYYRANNQVLDFSTFTGLYIFFDVDQRFIKGIRMENGAIVGKVKSIYREGSPGAPDRNDDPECDCTTHLDAVFECPQAFVYCHSVIVESEECNCGGGGPGGGGTGGGGTGGGGVGAMAMGAALVARTAVVVGVQTPTLRTHCASPRY